MTAAIAVHEHHWVHGPNANGIRGTFEHAHELPSKFHRHPCTGPGHSYNWKEVKKVRGEQLRFIGPKPGEDTFKVVLSSSWTAEHERNGADRVEHDELVAAARVASAAQAAGQSLASAGITEAGLVVRRLRNGFGLTALYEVDPPGAWCCGKPREAHADFDGHNWHCPEREGAEVEYRAAQTARAAAEIAEMGWAP